MKLMKLCKVLRTSWDWESGYTPYSKNSKQCVSVLKIFHWMLNIWNYDNQINTCFIKDETTYFYFHNQQALRIPWNNVSFSFCFSKSRLFMTFVLDYLAIYVAWKIIIYIQFSYFTFVASNFFYEKHSLRMGVWDRWGVVDSYQGVGAGIGRGYYLIEFFYFYFCLLVSHLPSLF